MKKLMVHNFFIVTVVDAYQQGGRGVVAARCMVPPFSVVENKSTFLNYIY